VSVYLIIWFNDSISSFHGLAKQVTLLKCFLWSDKQGGRLDRIELFYWIGDGKTYKGNFNRYVPVKVFDEISLYGTTYIINKIVDYWKPHIDLSTNIKDLKTKRDIILDLFRKEGGVETNHGYVLGDKKEVKMNFSRTHPYKYQINVMRKLLGLDYQPEYTNDPFIMDKAEYDNVSRYMKAFGDFETLKKPEDNNISSYDYDDPWIDVA